MNKQSIREIFDNISLSVISFLESHTGISEVEFNSERQGVAEVSLSKWEEENAPYKLPDDYKSFLQISDGLSLSWKIKKNDHIYPLGCMHLNRLRDIKAIKEDDFIFSAVGADYEESALENEKTEEPEEESKRFIAAFDMDCKVKDGKLALIYRNTVDKPQVWFQDLSCCWFFIANTFTDYFRLMIMHLGLPHWQYAFTQVGLDPQTLQWFRFLSPERLEIDLENQEMMAKKHENSKKTTYQSDKIKIESLRKKKRRMKLKDKGTGDNIIEKFSATSSKSAKFARTKVKGGKGKKK